MMTNPSGLNNQWSKIRRHPTTRAILRPTSNLLRLLRHNIGCVLPRLVRPRPDFLALSITSNCNLKCLGCKYGRGFMKGHQLALADVIRTLEQAKTLGISSIQIYGGEPLLHADVLQIVGKATSLFADVSLTTNGVMLSHHLDDLWGAGLRNIAIGLYGVGSDYDEYVGQSGAFARLERGLQLACERYGEKLRIVLGWLLMRRTCSRQAAEAAVAFSTRYGAMLSVNLLHYSLPYFSEGPHRCLALHNGDRGGLRDVIQVLLKANQERPHMVVPGTAGIRSIGDWMEKGAAMKVPCDHYDMLWVGPDGTLQMCYAAFGLGNVNTASLIECVGTPRHRNAASRCMTVDCPNCMCGFGTRIERNAWYRIRYSRLLGSMRR